MEFNLEEEMRALREVKTATEDIFNGVILNVKKDTVRLPNGNYSGREIIRHVGAVCIVPVTDSNEVIVERQYRYPYDTVITEIPAGKLDSKQEDRLSAAKRELREETGLTADEWTDLGAFFPAAAYSDEYITMYMARGLHQGQQELDADEFLNVVTVPLEEMVSDVMAGKVPDAKTQTAILKAARILGV